MPTNITDTDVFTDPAQTGVNGDDLDATNVLLWLQPLANRTNHLRNRVLGAGDALVHQIPLTPSAESANFSLNSSPFSYSQSDTSSAGLLIFPIPRPAGGTIVGVTAIVEGNSHGSMPTTKPIVTIYQQPPDGARVSLGTTTDPQTTVGGYDTVHAIDIALSHQMHGTHDYWITFSGETGGGAGNNKLKLRSLRVVMDPGDPLTPP